MERAPKHPRLLAPFVAFSLAAGVVGTTLGVVLLLRSQGSRSGPAWPDSQLHAQLQLFGFLLPFVIGFALYLVPRISGGEAIRSPRAAWGSLGSLAAAAGFVALEPFTSDARPLRVLTALGVFVGCALAAGVLLGPIRRFVRSMGGLRRAPYLALVQGALASLVLAAAFDAWALLRAGSAPAPLAELGASRAAWRLALEGFTVGMALGVAARMFTGFLGVPVQRANPSRGAAWTFWLSCVGWAGSLAVLAVGEVLLSDRAVAAGEILAGVSVLALCLRTGLARADSRLAIDRSVDPAFASGARSAFALLALAEVVGIVHGVSVWIAHPLSPFWIDVRRHLIALGFAMTLIATMAGRLAPGYARRPLRWPALRRFAMAAFPVAALLRGAEGFAFDLGQTRLLTVSALSAPVAAAAFAALFASLAATLIASRARGRDSSPSPPSTPSGSASP